MEKNVREELDVLKGMLNNWKRGFLSWASPEGDNDDVLMEFTEEIQMHVYPYVRRLFEANHLSDAEAKEFMHYCFSQVEDLRCQLSKAEID
jgi:hypothetical protein